jgi:hypothetical protein
VLWWRRHRPLIAANKASAMSMGFAGQRHHGVARHAEFDVNLTWIKRAVLKASIVQKLGA